MIIDFAVVPHKSIGPVELGMPRHVIRAILGELSAIQAAHEKWEIQFPDKDYFYDNAFQVSYDSELHADFIEVSAHSAYRVLFDEVSVHDSLPEKVVDAIALHADVDTNDHEYPTNLWFPELQLNLYCEHSEHDRFDTIGISCRDFK